MRNHETRTWTHLWRTTNLFNAFANAQLFFHVIFLFPYYHVKTKKFQQKKQLGVACLLIRKCVSIDLLLYHSTTCLLYISFACCESRFLQAIRTQPTMTPALRFFPPWSHRHERRIAASMQHMWSKTCGKWHLDFHRWWKSITSWIMSCLLLLIIHVLNGIKWKQMNSYCRIQP